MTQDSPVMTRRDLVGSTWALLAAIVAAGPSTASASQTSAVGPLPAPTIRDLAAKAFGHFRDGLATGEWEPWLAMLADDFTFFFPTGKYQGLHHGRAKAAEFFAYVRSVYPEGLQVTLDHTTVEGTRAIFEFRSEGTLVLPTERRAYKNRVAVALEFRDGQVVAYRE